jgi:hypothetical protein
LRADHRKEFTQFGVRTFATLSISVNSPQKRRSVYGNTAY